MMDREAERDWRKRMQQQDGEQPSILEDSGRLTLYGALGRKIADQAARISALEKALRNIAEGNLGDGPGQANYARIRHAARAALGEGER